MPTQVEIIQSCLRLALFYMIEKAKINFLQLKIIEGTIHSLCALTLDIIKISVLLQIKFAYLKRMGSVQLSCTFTYFNLG